MTDSPSENPYQSPSLLADDEAIVADMAVKDRLLLQKCQQQMVLLGLLWIVIGLLGLAITVIAPISETTSEFPGPLFFALISLVLASSVLHLIAGVLVCSKQRSAVYLGLVIGYPTAFVNLLLLNLCPFLMLGTGLLLAHRVLRWAKELHARGVRLSTPVELLP